VYVYERAQFLALDTTFDSLTAVETGGAIQVEGSASMELRRCTFRNCSTDVAASLVFSSYGGAVFAAVDSSKNIKIDSCLFTRNVAGRGAAMYMGGGNVSVHNSTFEWNQAQFGSAVYAQGEVRLWLINSNFTRNGFAVVDIYNASLHGLVFTPPGDRSRGGALALLKVAFQIQVEGCLFDHNVAKINPQSIMPAGEGGAVFAFSSYLQFKNCTFQDNEASTSAGALYIEECSCGLRFMTFRRNSAGSAGGAIVSSAFFEPTLSIDGGVFEDNYAYDVGGAIAIYAAHTVWLDLGVRFSRNLATYGGALYLAGPGSELEINDAHFIENKAVNITYFLPAGGALYLPRGTDLKLTDSEFVGNDASAYGAGMAGWSLAHHCVCTDRTVCMLGVGGAIYSEQATTDPLLAQRNTFRQNGAAWGE